MMRACAPWTRARDTRRRVFVCALTLGLTPLHLARAQDGGAASPTHAEVRAWLHRCDRGIWNLQPAEVALCARALTAARAIGDEKLLTEALKGRAFVEIGLAQWRAAHATGREVLARERLHGPTTTTREMRTT